MTTPRVVPGSRRVKTAWTDPEHVRLTQETPEERVNPKRSVRLKAADPSDPWAVIESPEVTADISSDAYGDVVRELPAGGES